MKRSKGNKKGKKKVSQGQRSHALDANIIANIIEGKLKIVYTPWVAWKSLVVTSNHFKR